MRCESGKTIFTFAEQAKWIRLGRIYPICNGDILDLYGCVGLGTKVVTLQ
jgi:hypothetical protein